MPLQNEPWFNRVLGVIAMVVSLVGGIGSGQLFPALIFCALVVLILSVVALQCEVRSLHSTLLQQAEDETERSQAAAGKKSPTRFG